MNEYKRILVVIRMIQSCRTAIQVGVSLAHNYKAELFVIYSTYNLFGLKGWNFGTLSIEKEYQKDLMETRDKLSKLIEAERTDSMHITELVREGEPTEEILKQSMKKKLTLWSCLLTQKAILRIFSFSEATMNWLERCPARSFL